MRANNQNRHFAWFLGVIVVVTVACSSSTTTPPRTGSGGVGPAGGSNGTSVGGGGVSTGGVAGTNGGLRDAGIVAAGGTTKPGGEGGIDAPSIACPQLYSDAGIFPGTSLWTWSGGDWQMPSSVFAGSSTDCAGAPEGATCFKTTIGADQGTTANYAGWGIFAGSNNNWNLSACTRLVFCAQTNGTLKALKVEVQTGSSNGVKSTLTIPMAPGAWQPVVITKDQFLGADFSSIYGGFLVTATGGDQTFRIDNVRWDSASGNLPPGACQSSGTGGTGGSGAVDAALMDGPAATGGVIGATGGATGSADAPAIGGSSASGGGLGTGGSAIDGALSSGGAGSGGTPATGGIDAGISADGSGTGGTLAACPVLYSDTGIPSGADVWTWDGTTWGLPPGTFDGSSRDCNGASEGSACFKTASGANSASATNYAGWGIITVSAKNWDLSACNRLLFCAQVDGAVGTLKVEIQEASNSGTKHTVRPSITPGGWQLISITKAQFGSASWANIFGPFYVTVENGGQTFRIDNVRWDSGSGSVPDCRSLDAGGTGDGGGG